MNAKWQVQITDVIDHLVKKSTIDGVVKKDPQERGTISLGEGYGKGFGEKSLPLKIIILFSVA